MITDSENELDKIYLSYNKILKKLVKKIFYDINKLE